MCDHKNVGKHRKIQVMDINLYKKIIDEIAIVDPNIRVWQIFFGDPFLCKDMAHRIRYAKNKGLTDVVLNTNGQLMTPQRSLPLIEAGLDAIYVGIDAATADTYKKIRVGGSFQKAIDNALSYRDLLREKGRKSQKLYVQFVVSDINKDEIESFKAFWYNQDVAVKIRPKVSWAGLVEANNLNANDTLERRPCYWLMRTLNICADGRIALCSVDVHCRVPSGDVNHNSIRQIWKNGALKKYRRMQLDGCYKNLPSICFNCADWQSGYAEFYNPAQNEDGECND
jgi:MoaA/NifB/PqqE/SkfB family radical SAM enzyme